MSYTNDELPFLESFVSSGLVQFLEENKIALREKLLSSSINRLDSYIESTEQNPIILQLGLCKIQVQGREAAIIARDSLKNSLENYYK